MNGLRALGQSWNLAYVEANRVEQVLCPTGAALLATYATTLQPLTFETAWTVAQIRALTAWAKRAHHMDSS